MRAVVNFFTHVKQHEKKKSKTEQALLWYLLLSERTATFGLYKLENRVQM